MSGINDIDTIIPGGTFDAFADADKQVQAVTNKQYVHIRTQQRNGRKSLTTVQGLDKKFEYSKGRTFYEKLFAVSHDLKRSAPYLFVEFSLR